MPANKRILAATELVLIFPASLFLTAVVARYLQPPQHDLTQTAERIVRWYSARYWTLWVLLIGLPLAALFTGCVTLLRTWNDDTELRQATRQPSSRIRWPFATLTIAGATLAAGLILVVVVLHMLAT